MSRWTVTYSALIAPIKSTPSSNLKDSFTIVTLCSMFVLTKCFFFTFLMMFVTIVFFLHVHNVLFKEEKTDFVTCRCLREV